MAFLKVECKSSGTYLRIMESYRDPEGKSRNHTLYSLGKVEDYTPDQLRRIGLRLYELGGGELKKMLGGELEEIARYNYGFYQVFNKALAAFGLENTLKFIRRKHKLEFDLANAVILMLLERLHDPGSKRSNFLNQQDYLGVDQVSLQHLYRALDKLADYSEVIQQKIFQRGRSMFDQQLDIVFYDVTTLYFESDVEQEGSLRQKGFSKDGKVGSTQILFCMMIDKDKQPVGYQIFKGNTYEGHTFVKAIEDLKKRYLIDKVIVVADRGMLSRENISVVLDNGFEFIVGEKITSLPKNIQAPLLDLSNYKSEWVYTDNEDEQIKIKYYITHYEGKTIIATYSKNRAEKDKYDREQKLQKAQKLLQTPSLLKKKSSRYFIKSEGEEKYSLDEEKVKHNERYDGLLAIATNNQTLSTVEILDQYKQLYKIEHTFRSFKSHLETRPMFHWANKRIEGHICLCYLGFALLNYVLNTLARQKMHISESQLRKMLDKMQVSLLKHDTEEIYIRSAAQPNEVHLQNKLGIKPLPPIIPKDSILHYL